MLLCISGKLHVIFIQLCREIPRSMVCALFLFSIQPKVSYLAFFTAPLVCGMFPGSISTVVFIALATYDWLTSLIYDFNLYGHQVRRLDSVENAARGTTLIHQHQWDEAEHTICSVSSLLNCPSKSLSFTSLSLQLQQYTGPSDLRNTDIVVLVSSSNE